MSHSNESATPEPGEQPESDLQKMQETTKAILEAALDAGVPATEALDISRPRNWNN